MTTPTTKARFLIALAMIAIIALPVVEAVAWHAFRYDGTYYTVSDSPVLISNPSASANGKYFRASDSHLVSYNPITYAWSDEGAFPASSTDVQGSSNGDIPPGSCNPALAAGCTLETAPTPCKWNAVRKQWSDPSLETDFEAGKCASIVMRWDGSAFTVQYRTALRENAATSTDIAGEYWPWAQVQETDNAGSPTADPVDLTDLEICDLNTPPTTAGQFVANCVWSASAQEGTPTGGDGLVAMATLEHRLSNGQMAGQQESGQLQCYRPSVEFSGAWCVEGDSTGPLVDVEV